MGITVRKLLDKAYVLGTLTTWVNVLMCYCRYDVGFEVPKHLYVWCWKESSCAIVGFKIFYLNNFVSFYFMLPDHFFPERSAVLDPQH